MNGVISTAGGLLSLLGEKLTKPSKSHCGSIVVGGVLLQPHFVTFQDPSQLTPQSPGCIWGLAWSLLGIFDSPSRFISGVYLAMCDFLVLSPLL